MLDFPRWGREPWGRSGFGVFIVFCAALLLIVLRFIILLFAPGFSLKKPRSKA
jgi:hypothetical protein